MRKALVMAALGLLLAAGVAAAALATPGNGNPGSPGGTCSHGASDKPCKDDPQPEHGQDCDDHGVAHGNEDHCAPGGTTTGGGGTTTDDGGDDDDTPGGGGGDDTPGGGGGGVAGTGSVKPAVQTPGASQPSVGGELPFTL
jgi:large repetitive protein